MSWVSSRRPSGEARSGRTKRVALSPSYGSGPTHSRWEPQSSRARATSLGWGAGAPPAARGLLSEPRRWSNGRSVPVKLEVDLAPFGAVGERAVRLLGQADHVTCQRAVRGGRRAVTH